MVKFSDIKVGDAVVAVARVSDTPRVRLVHSRDATSLTCSIDMAPVGASLMYRVYEEHVLAHYRKVEEPKPKELSPRHLAFLREIRPTGLWLQDHPMRWGSETALAMPMEKWRPLAKRYIREINRAEGAKLHLDGGFVTWVSNES